MARPQSHNLTLALNNVAMDATAAEEVKGGVRRLLNQINGAPFVSKKRNRLHQHRKFVLLFYGGWVQCNECLQPAGNKPSKCNKIPPPPFLLKNVIFKPAH